MTWTPPPPTEGPDGYLWTDPPAFILEAMRATGISDTQSIALLRSIIWQTYQLLQEGKQVRWPLVGRWEVRYYSRVEYTNGLPRFDPDTGDPIIPNVITKPPMYRISFRPRWRNNR